MVQDGQKDFMMIWEGKEQSRRIQDGLEGSRMVWEGPGRSDTVQEGLGGSRTVCLPTQFADTDLYSILSLAT